MSQRTIGRKGQHVAALPHVAARICELQDAARERSDLTVDALLQSYQDIVNADITDYVEIEDGKVRLRDLDRLTPAQLKCIRRLRQGPYGPELELYDRLAALNAIARHLGMFDQRHLHELSSGFELHLYFDREQPPMQPGEEVGEVVGELADT